MRTETLTKTFDVEGALEAHEATIATSAKTIRMMIADVYSNPTLAVVRELATNASDSHARAQNDAPFFVHCPTILTPEFYVRDYGVGMDHEKVCGTYIVVGKSDKDQGDEEAGMWGIGAMAPFAKADQYYFTCFDGVTARHYGFGMNKAGKPTLVLMGEEESSEPRGVRVGLSVEKDDFPAFEAAIKQIAVGFGPLMQTNAKLYDKPRETLSAEYEPDLSGEGWASYRNLPLSSSSRWWARMGGVLYPLQPSFSFSNRWGDSRQFILDCPIGAFKITPSREAVVVNPDTTDYFQARYQAVLAEAHAKVMEQVQDIENLIEFHEKVAKLKPDFVTAPFAHPATGLISTALVLAQPKTLLEAKLLANGRWSFDFKHTFDFKTPPTKSVTVINTIQPYLDPSRSTATSAPATNWLSASEIKRISRLVRMFMDAKGRTNMTILFGAPDDPKFWASADPEIEVEYLTLEDLRDAAPVRATPLVENRQPVIKGLALAKAAGDQRVVSEIKSKIDDKPTAYVPSSVYRENASAIFKLSRRIGLGGLYIANDDALKLVKAARIRPLLTLAERALETGDFNIAEWLVLRDAATAQNPANSANGFLGKLREHAPKTFEKLRALGGPMGAACDLASVTANARFDLVTPEEVKALMTLLKNNPRTIRSEVEAVTKSKDRLCAHYYNPTNRFFDAIQALKKPDQIARAGKALLEVLKQFPLDEAVSIY